LDDGYRVDYLEECLRRLVRNRPHSSYCP
jgi:hypothetical protein